VRAHRWLAWGDEARVLEVTARRLPGEGGRERVHVSLTDSALADANENGAGAPAVEAVVLLAPGYPEAPAPHAVSIGTPRASRFADGGLYDDEMFHGPCWQGVRGIAQTGTRGAVAELAVLPFSPLLRAPAEPRFALDPVVLDAAGQVIGFWTTEHLERGRVVFPFALDALDVFGPQHPVGETPTCSAAIELVGDQLMRSDLDVIGGDGRVWMRLTGWQDKRFDVPPRFRQLAHVTDRTPISEEWAGPAAELGPDGSFQCRRLTAELPDRAFWKRVWAHRVLSRAEREQFRSLRQPEPRVLEWLGARTAAKEAVIALAARHAGLELLPADVEVRQDAAGRPFVNGRMLADAGLEPVVSLAHSQGVAVALVGLGGRVGIDVERIRADRNGYAEVAFAPPERELVERMPAELRGEWQLRCWCAKEAVGKALGTGLTRGPQGLAVTAIDPGSGRILVELGPEMAADHPELATAPVVVHSLRQEDLVVATTLCDQEVPDDDAA
jgi:phosphopantetheinyl transferase